MMQKISTNFRWDYLLRGRQMQVGYVKIAFFDRSRSLQLRRLIVENWCSSTTVVRVHDGALTQYYAVSSTTLVLVDLGWSQLRSIWHLQGRLYGTLWMTRAILHARCAIVKSLATIRVPNCAVSRIKWQLLKVLLRLIYAICLR